MSGVESSIPEGAAGDSLRAEAAQYPSWRQMHGSGRIGSSATGPIVTIEMPLEEYAPEEGQVPGT